MKHKCREPGKALVVAWSSRVLPRHAQGRARPIGTSSHCRIRRPSRHAATCGKLRALQRTQGAYRTHVRHKPGQGLLLRGFPLIAAHTCAIGGMYTFAKASGSTPHVHRQANSRASTSAAKLTCESQRPSRSDNTSHTCTAPVHTVAPASTCPPVPITDAPLKTTSSGSQVQIAA